MRGVVSAEVSASWPLAALEAQAVASRTYALTAHAGGSRFDVYADTRSQVYRGVAAQTPQTDAAVAATAGQIVTYQGRPAITYFFASSGGRTENIENSFIGSDGRSRGCAAWSTRTSAATCTRGSSRSASPPPPRRLRGLVHGSFQGIEVVKRGFSPRIVSAYVLGSARAHAVSGPALAARLGLYSAWAYFSRAKAQSVKPEPDRSGWAPLASPAPAAAPGARAPSQGGVAPASSAEASAASASGGASAPAGVARAPSVGGGTSAPS